MWLSKYVLLIVIQVAMEEEAVSLRKDDESSFGYVFINNGVLYMWRGKYIHSGKEVDFRK